METPAILQQITAVWQNQIEACRRAKWDAFDETAQKAWGFLGKTYVDLYLRESDPDLGVVTPSYKARINKVAQYVDVMLPYIAHRIPNRMVSPDRPPMPMELAELVMAMYGAMVPTEATPQEKLVCWLARWWLNYLPGEYGLAKEARLALIEALVKGRGVVWHELVETPTGPIPASFFDTVDNLLIDADALTLREAGYVIRRREQSVYRVAERFGIPAEKLRGQRSTSFSTSTSAVLHPSDKAGETRPEDRDVVVYWEVFSRIGLGHKLFAASEELREVADSLDRAGEHVWLVICPGLDYPLNLQPELLDSSVRTEDELIAALRWPVETYEEKATPWPFTEIDFHPNTDNPWARAPLESAMPIQIFLDQLYSIVMSKIASTHRDIIITAQALEDALQEAIASGKDQIVVPYAGVPGTEIEQLVKIIQFPPMNSDVWRVFSQFERAYEEITGMSPLLSGGPPPTQDRSAAMTNAREARLSSRPDDMADTVEDWHGRIASKEALLSRLYVTPRTAARLFGEPQPPEPGQAIPLEAGMGMEAGMDMGIAQEMDAAQAMEGAPLSGEEAEMAPLPQEQPFAMGPLTQTWATYWNTNDPAEAAADWSYTVESGSGRRKNQARIVADGQQLLQLFLPAAQQFVMAGQVQQWNALVEVAQEMLEIPLTKLMLAAPPPPPPMPEEEVTAPQEPAMME